MQYKDYMQFSIPIPLEINTKLKVVAAAKHKSVKELFFEMVGEYFEREENQKILVNIRG